MIYSGALTRLLNFVCTHAYAHARKPYLCDFTSSDTLALSHRSRAVSGARVVACYAEEMK